MIYLLEQPNKKYIFTLEALANYHPCTPGITSGASAQKAQI